MLTDDEQDVLTRLEAWRDSLEGAIRALDDEWPEVARKHYKAIKDRLKTEAQGISTQRGQAELTDTEKRWYDRPIRHAAAHLLAPTNGSTERIASSLQEARMDIELMIHRLRAYEKKSQASRGGG